MRKIGATYRVRTNDLYLEKERYRNIKSTTELMRIKYLIMGDLENWSDISGSNR